MPESEECVFVGPLPENPRVHRFVCKTHINTMYGIVAPKHCDKAKEKSDGREN